MAQFPAAVAEYWHIDTGGAAGAPAGGLMKRQGPQPQGITNYISVASVDESAAKVEPRGGKICMGKTAVPQMGHFVICQDPEQNTFALWEREERAQARCPERAGSFVVPAERKWNPARSKTGRRRGRGQPVGQRPALTRATRCAGRPEGFTDCCGSGRPCSTAAFSRQRPRPPRSHPQLFYNPMTKCNATAASGTGSTTTRCW
jgi:uncharacterized protein